MLLASLSCWIIFTLPLGFVQPPPTSCMVKVNDTPYIEASSREQRAKRSMDLDEFYYHENKNDYLEVASNVVFERLRRDINDNEVFDHTKKSNLKSDLKEINTFEIPYNIEENNVGGFENSIPNNNIVHYLKSSRVRRQATLTDESNIKDLEYKQTVFEDKTDNLDAKTIDLETLQQKNRPADILEYKRFMKVHTLLLSLIRTYGLNKT